MNHRIDCPVTSRPKPQPDKQFTTLAAVSCTAGRTRSEKPTREGGITDPDLQRICDAWPTLPDPIKAAILAIVASTGVQFQREDHD